MKDVLIMPKELNIKFTPRDVQHSEYDWANIFHGDDLVGKARCLLAGRTMTIFSINIFQEFEGHGYGKQFVVSAKKSFDTIIADRVRFTAIGFWEKVGFVNNNDGNWVYKKKTGVSRLKMNK